MGGASGLPRSTVGSVLRRLGLGRLRLPTVDRPVVRYEREHPGELLHVDTKALGRIVRPGHRVTGDRRQRSRRVGWDHVHVAIDDASRVAYVEVLRTQQIPDAVGFLARAVAWFAAHGVRVERVMTDNGSAYRSRALQRPVPSSRCAISPRGPYTPRTNGKAERFIQTLLREWAYHRPYATSQRRARALAAVAALLQRPPATHELALSRSHDSASAGPPMNNLPGFDS